MVYFYTVLAYNHTLLLCKQILFPKKKNEKWQKDIIKIGSLHVFNWRVGVRNKRITRKNTLRKIRTIVLFTVLA